MESVLGWLGQIFEALLSFIPRIVKIRSTNKGVKFKCGKYPILWEPGLHLYIPAFSDYCDHEVVRQTKELPKQLIFSKDGVQFGLKGIVIYEIDDLLELITGTADWTDIIRDYSVEIIETVVGDSDSNDIKTNRKKIKKEIFEKLGPLLSKHGVKINRFSLKDCCIPEYNISIWNIDDNDESDYITE